MKNTLKTIIGRLDLTKLYPLARRFINLKKPKKPVWESIDHILHTESGAVHVRLYPVKDSHKLIIFFHGGGWATESTDTYDRVCAALARTTGCHVLSADYSLAPEHKFPTALNECSGVIKEVLKASDIFGIGKEDIILCGDSAGGNLAAAAALLGRDRGEYLISKMVLIYPVTACDYGSDALFRSVHEKAEGYSLTSVHMQDYVELYMRSRADLASPYFAPINAVHFRNMPDTLIITAENDPLRDEGIAFGRQLKSGGSKVYAYRINGAEHGFFADTEDCHAVMTRKMIKRFIYDQNIL